MSTQQPKHILIAPLDWGLGHTTRCVPIISHILRLGHHPVIACSASQRGFIEETFGAIDTIHLEGYNITYSKWNKWAQAGLLSQVPGIVKTINQENKWLQQLSRERRLDGIISDNRYGLFHPVIPSAIITHQLSVQSGMGSAADRLIQKLHYKYLDRFQVTWVPDAPGIPNLGGKLSHPSALPKCTKYIGLLSRFGPSEQSISDDGNNHLLILLSGPEPQRSALSAILWQQAQHYDGKITFVEGYENAVSPKSVPDHITYHKRLTDKTLLPLLQNAAMVICRSGYSTLMDLAALQKKAILIPTHGQTEQEYLGKYLHEQGIFYCSKQQGFDLGNALMKANEFPYTVPLLQNSYNDYKVIIEDWLQTL